MKTQPSRMTGTWASLTPQREFLSCSSSGSALFWVLGQGVIDDLFKLTR